MSEFSLDQVMNQMRVIAQKNSMPEWQQAGGGDFSEIFMKSLNQVNALQGEATALQGAYTRGEEGVDIPEVMVAMQKASLSFEATVQVRNHLLSAYQEIMNMQV